MVNRGVLAQPYWWDEQWTISVAHTEADIDRHIATFAEIAPAAGASAKRAARRGHRRPLSFAAGSVELYRA